MISDEERREVARRLREAASYYESMERDVDFYPVESTLGLKPAGETAYTPESVRSLADLIDPDTTTDTTKSPELTTKCDRDALLALADELEEDACWEVQAQGDTSGAWRAKDTCDRIREALEVER